MATWKPATQKAEARVPVEPAGWKQSERSIAEPAEAPVSASQMGAPWVPLMPAL